MSRVKSAASICCALAFACLGVGCASSAGDDQPVVDAGPDAPPAPKLSLRFWVPDGNEPVPVTVATDDFNALCFDVTSEVDVEFRRLPLEFHSDQAPIAVPPTTGLVYRGTTQYRDIKVMGDGHVVSGPAELSTSDTDPTQRVELRDSFTVRASEQPKLFCVQLDVNNESAIVGNGLSVKLLPFEPGDVVLAADGSDLPLEYIERLDGDRQPLPIPEEDLTIRGVQCAGMEVGRPTVTETPLPTTALDYGDFVAYNATFTAPPERDLLVEWLSYRIHIISPNPEATVLDLPRLAFPNGPNLAGSGWVETSGNGCKNLLASWTDRCIRVRLAQPIYIPKGGRKTIELRMTLSGTLTDGEWMSTMPVMDPFGPQIGLLTDGHIDAMYENNVMMSNDGVCWWNGYYVHWGSPIGLSLIYTAPSQN